MGFVLQRQRRAVEAVFDKFDILIKQESRFLFENKKINLLGISRGAGTCSDIHNINIAILSLDYPFNPELHRLPKFPITCQGAVLLRNPNHEEIEAGKISFSPNAPICAVEGLKLVSRSENDIFCLNSNGKSITYVIL